MATVTEEFEEVKLSVKEIGVSIANSTHVFFVHQTNECDLVKSFAE